MFGMQVRQCFVAYCWKNKTFKVIFIQDLINIKPERYVLLSRYSHLRHIKHCNWTLQYSGIKIYDQAIKKIKDRLGYFNFLLSIVVE